jgi:hypothetical protein
MSFNAVAKRIFTSRWFISAAAVVAAYSLAGFLLVPYLAAHYLKRYVKDQLAHELVLQKLRFNPFTLTAEAEGLGVAGKNQPPLVSIAAFSANFSFFSSLYERAWTFSSIRMSDPFLRVVVQEDGRLNLSELFRHRKGAEPTRAQHAGNQSLPRILIDQTTLRGGKINFVDRRVSPPADVVLSSLNLDLEELTTLPKLTGSYTISGRTKAGEGLKWRGSISLNPVRSEGAFKLEAVKAATVWEFVRDKISCDKPSGEATLTSDYLFDLSGKQPLFTLSGLDFDVTNLAVTLKGATSPMLTLKKAAGRQGNFQWNRRSAALENLRMESGRLRMEVDEMGIVDWRKLTGGQEQTPDREVLNGSQSSRKRAGDPKSPLTDWSASLAAFKLENFQVDLTDLTTDPAARLRLESLDLDLQGLSTDPAASVNFDLHTRIEAGGEISVKGRTSPWQRIADGHARLTGLSLLSLQPYLNRVARLTIDAGSLDASGEFSYNGEKGGKGFTYQGQGKITSMKARSAENTQPPWGWDSLSCDAVRLNLSPGSLDLGEVKLVGASGRLIIFPDKTVNLSRILIQKKAEKKTKNSADFRIIIGRIHLEQGSLEFADLSLTPRFSAQIHALHGSINGISSIPGTSAQIELEGQVNRNGMTWIRGTSDLFHPTGTTKIRMDFSNIEMTRLTPYSVHFAGYRIASGILTLNLHYRIENGRMVGRNRIIAQKFTLGERVKSPTALDLPFELAIALLKDSSGTIDIGLPVEGNLNNPRFDYGAIIRKALADLLVKIVTAPFAWLADLVGYKRGNFEKVFFDPGQANLLPPEKEKLGKLSEALAKRPKLLLEIRGGYDPRVDIPALKSALLRRKLASKENQPLTPGENPGPIVFHDPETQKALEALEKAAAWTGFYKNLYRRLKEQVKIPESRLTSLAESRGSEVRRFLTSTEHVDRGRLKVLEPIRTENRNSREVESKLSLDAAG